MHRREPAVLRLQGSFFPTLPRAALVVVGERAGPQRELSTSRSVSVSRLGDSRALENDFVAVSAAAVLDAVRDAGGHRLRHVQANSLLRPGEPGEICRKNSKKTF